MQLRKRKFRRLFVFDDFPVTELPDGSIADIPLPPGTASLIIRLARYADEELRKYLARRPDAISRRASVGAR